MPPIFTYIVLASMGGALLVFLMEFARSRQLNSLLAQCGVLLTAFLVLNVTTGFPQPSGRQAFGGASPLGAIGLMFVCVMVGMMARYTFYLKKSFSWLSLLKPLCISPIVLLPLIGSVQSNQDLESIQLISFAFLAFQNGFFWPMVLEHEKAKGNA